MHSIGKLAFNSIKIFISFLQERCQAGLKTLKTLIMSRPNHRLRFLDVLLEFTSSDKKEVRAVRKYPV